MTTRHRDSADCDHDIGTLPMNWKNWFAFFFSGSIDSQYCTWKLYWNNISAVDLKCLKSNCFSFYHVLIDLIILISCFVRSCFTQFNSFNIYEINRRFWVARNIFITIWQAHFVFSLCIGYFFFFFFFIKTNINLFICKSPTIESGMKKKISIWNEIAHKLHECKLVMGVFFFFLYLSRLLHMFHLIWI